MKTKTPKAPPKNIAEMSRTEILSYWQEERRKLFIDLNQSMTYEAIGNLFGITRQAVGQTITKKSPQV